MLRRFAVRRPLAAVGACLAGGIAVAGIVGGPPAAAAVGGCGSAAARATAAGAADSEPHDEATATLRDYFRTHPQQYNDLRGIMAPI